MFSKEEIINAVKKIFAENGEKAVGEAIFKKQTGIGRYEWGRYWARFGDLLEEAGYERNKPWTRVNDEVLIRKMIVFIRKIGKYPTIGELRIEGEQNSDFPYSIIKKRKQPYIVQKLVEYCRTKKNYKDILKICEPVFDRSIQNIESKVETGNRNVGEVYLFKSGRFYKIGKTNNLVRRGNEIKVQMPEAINLIHVIKTDDPSGIEAYWHKRFEQQRRNGEWFTLSQEDILSFKRWKKIY